ncbi:aminopeptidase N-like [Frankliniella occidentalis]|uniref:Aminopeptidase N-like n=1 Tax=Frankliniella occidentalis TaxID=133901 RepID=A0A9C6X8P1_FRAOC|nr:aminopeptidase N-like [Frankliniella occidentalis]
MTGCPLLLAVAAVVVAASAAPGPHEPLALVPAHVRAGRTLAEQAEASGLVLPPRLVSKPKPAAVPGMEVVRGAQPYPFGLADPLPPPRAAKRSTAAARRYRRDANDDIYEESRLPTSVVPTRYTVTMSPNLDKGIFYGSTDIYLNVNSATSRIALHGTPDLTMKEVQILKWDRKLKEFSKNGNATLKRLSSLEELQRIIVDLTTELEVGEHYLLRFPVFAAYLRDDLKGFYLSTYEDSYGNVVRIGTTQFEPPAARFAFPCFDEPEFKARFKIIIEHDRGLTARSNMPVVRQTRPTLLTVTTEFDETLPMSTYLLAWVVSDFSYVSSKDGTFSTWGRDNLLTLSTSWLSQSVGPAALEGLKDFTGIAYALPKVDQFAIPDFDAGAMENWGLVTYREEYLLESSATDIRIREFIGTTVCHELGHQWTGNLVTLDWWSNTWLNEGFATYFESVICDKIIPEWKLMDKYVTDNVHVGIANDVVPGQLAMSSPVITLDGVEAKFDRISYKKGGAVLRMFEHIMGTETFKKAMHRYLSVNSFKNGSPDRLFRAMDAEIALLAESPLPEGVTFAQVAKTWTEQAGVPVVTATRDYDKAQLTVSQEKFMYAESEDGDGDTLWYVPIPVEVQPKSADWSWSLTAAAANKRWLTPEAPSLSRDLDASKTEWIVLNPRQIGYYLVNYDEANWKLLSAELAANPNALHASSRTQLVHDALALARAGKLSYEVALPFLQSLKLEREATPWRAGVVALTFLRERLTATPAGYALKAFIKDITADAYSAVGFSVPDTWQSFKDFSKDDERFLRYYLASYACDAGNELCAEAAVKALTMSLDEGEMIHADVRTTALCYGVQNSADLFEKVLQEWKSAETSTEQAAHATALACTLEHKLLENVLDDILDGSLVKSSSDLQQLVDAIIVRWENHKFMIDYYKNNWKRIRSFASGKMYYFNLLIALVGDVRTPEELDEVKALVTTIFPDETRTERLELELRLKAADKELDWYRKHYDSVSKWLFAATNTEPVDPTEPTRPTQATTEQTTPTQMTTEQTKPTQGTTEPTRTTEQTRSTEQTRATPTKPVGPTTTPTVPSSTQRSAASSRTQIDALVLLLAALLTRVAF